MRRIRWPEVRHSKTWSPSRLTRTIAGQSLVVREADYGIDGIILGCILEHESVKVGQVNSQHHGNKEGALQEI